MAQEFSNTPWGRWEVLLDEVYCKVKRIVVNPGKRLSYQKHFKREELWTIVQGTATVTLDDIETEYNEGEVVFIPKESAHRVANTSEEPLVFIEIQRGTYFGEDDIVRLQDDYGRH
jgi:mannose-6-phosphate isomerase